MLKLILFRIRFDRYFKPNKNELGVILQELQRQKTGNKLLKQKLFKQQEKINLLKQEVNALASYCNDYKNKYEGTL